MGAMEGKEKYLLRRDWEGFSQELKFSERFAYANLSETLSSWEQPSRSVVVAAVPKSTTVRILST